MTVNGCACNPDYQKIQQQLQQPSPQKHRRLPAACDHVSGTEHPVKTGTTGSSNGSPVIRHQPPTPNPETGTPTGGPRDEESCCCKLSYADYSSIDGSRELSSTSNLQSPQTLHAPTCHTGRLAEKLFEDEDESDFCASCASHPKVNLVLYCFGYIGFMIFASCIFSMTEKHVEVGHKADLIRLQVDFLNKYPSVDVESLELLLSHVTLLHGRGINWEPLSLESRRLLLKGRNGSRSASSEQDVADQALKLGSGRKDNARTGSSTASPRVESRTHGARAARDTRTGGHGGSGDAPSAPSASGSIVTVIDYSRFTTSVNWEFTSSLLFVTSLVTTIGYGHITPLTQFGKFLAIVFSMIGIPLTLTLLSTLSSLLLRSPVRRFETSLAIIATRLTTKANVLMVRLSHLIILTILLLVICFFLPAVLFHSLEQDWTYLDSVYFCYVSLTTIGLGDYVPAVTMPGSADLTYYRLGAVLFLYFGLTFIMLWLALVYRIPQLNLNQILLSTETDNKLKARETLRILNTCTRVQETSASTSRSSISKSYGTQNIPSTP